jgi:KaiC/GvpD/RAD55 family RecA-like ATPase
MRRVKRAYGVNDLLNKNFVTYEFDGKWADSFGQPERNFRMMLYGDSGNGKTEFVVQFTKYLAGFGKVYLNSFEQGMSQSLKDAFQRNKMWEVAGNVIIGDQDTFEDLHRRMGSRNSPKFCIIDSIDYMDLTKEQYQQLVADYPHKSFVMTSWAAGRKPKTQAAKDINYMADIKCRVHDFKVYPRCRFGGNQHFEIWPEYWEKKRAEAQAKAEAKNDE